MFQSTLYLLRIKKNENIFLFWAVVFYRCGHVCLFFLAPSLSSPKLSRGRSLNISQLLQPLDHVVHYVSFLTPTKKEINEINYTCRFLWIKITLATRKNLGGGGGRSTLTTTTTTVSLP